MEVLAPAGDMEIAKLAFRAGADACYIGGEFSARAYARNFSREEIREILRYAHQFDKKIYVAVNTMVLEREMESALSYLGFLYEAGADAVIVADMGLAAAAHALYPALPLHASTQMGVEDARGAAFARKLGCCRVVPARETPLDVLREIADTGIEVEAFCHGALCSGISGMCLLSSFIGGRSGNRGRCAQPCRMAYTLLGEKAYHLSTADLCAIGLLGELRRVGVSSLKIEGRMKRREYVAITVDAYRRAVDALEEGREFDTEAAVLAMQKVYNRGGFTQGYLKGGRDVTYPARQNHMGVYVGRLEKAAGRRGFVRTVETLQKGDGLEFMGRSSHGGLTIGFADPTPGGWQIPLPAGAKAGDRVFRTTDARQMEEAGQIGERELKIPVNMQLWLAEGEPARLVLSAREQEAEAAGAVCQQAQKPMEGGRIREILQKTGGTSFALKTCQIHWVGNPFLRVAELNALRREGLAALEEKIAEAGRPYLPEPGTRQESEARPAPWNGIAAQVKTPGQARAAWENGAGRVYFAPEEYTESALQTIGREKRGEVYLVLPPFWSRADRKRLNELLPWLREHMDGWVCANPGQVEFARETGMPFVCDYWMNTANRESASALFRAGAAGITASTELDQAMLREMDGAAAEAVVYGRLPLMNLRHCPLKKQGNCGKCGHAVLEDRAGYAFPLERAGIADCLLQVCNSVPLWIGDLPALRAAGIRSLRLVFTREDAETAGRVTRAFSSAWRAGQKVQGDGIIKETTTTGHFRRGIE